MIKHIVLWKLDDSYSEQEKDKLLNDFRTRLMKLDELITELLHLEVYLRDKATPESNYDIMLETVFNKLEDLDIYQNHPEHQKVVSFAKGIKMQRAAIDFSF